MSRNRQRLVTRKRLAALLGGLMMSLPAMTNVADAHHPNRENQPVHQRIDVIGPVGNNLPPGHRRTYNRPSYIEGKVAYHIAPSSQEAMTWHRSVHRGLYEKDQRCKRCTDLYFYPKPWEALLTGPRPPQTASVRDQGIELDYGDGVIGDPLPEDVESMLELQSPPLQPPAIDGLDSTSSLGQPSASETIAFGAQGQFGLAAVSHASSTSSVAGPEPAISVDQPEKVIAATGNQNKTAKKPSRLSQLAKPIYLRFSPGRTE
ncbi:hypothetical protein [Roseiconus lacunae]|uniref:Uncharacterized protein n=1 Tax=Roseiconus lacunae TaxID=2605694 RepID=A0ABT7PPW9_9BACT|nr:hypothetical protein [Roseiconus lacunae]MDM4018398.1 hypothetical protein [Roseiconus lacunae]